MTRRSAGALAIAAALLAVSAAPASAADGYSMTGIDLMFQWFFKRP